MKLAFIVSHPIQYYAPLHRRLAKRDDLQIKVFFTWHGAEAAQFDAGFQQNIAWDIPLVDGYEYTVVPNTARRPGSAHFFGLRNPSLVADVLAWQPDAVHITGYGYTSHLGAIRSLARRGVPVLFRGDSHLLDERQSGPRWLLKRALLSKVFSWPSAFLCVGRANRDYYRAFHVPEEKLFDCPHSIEVRRFSEPDEELEKQAAAWRKELAIPPGNKVMVFAGKFEDKKRPVPLMEAMLKSPDAGILLVMIGDGQYGREVRELAARHPQHFRLLPFQNQSKMPLVYRLGDAVVLPSAYGETWGLMVNEAMACGRPALVSNRVGCHADVIRPGWNGDVFRVDDWTDFNQKLGSFNFIGGDSRRKEIKEWSANWSIEKTEEALIAALKAVIPKNRST